MGDLIFYFDYFSNLILALAQLFAEFVRESPILLLTTGFLVLGGAIGIFGRLLKKN